MISEILDQNQSNSIVKFLQQLIQNINMQDNQSIEKILRKQALKRITDYIHPQILLQHQPISAKQCEQLQNQLRQLVRQKVEQVRREYEARDYQKNYDEVYSQFVRMASTNEAQQQFLCKQIASMNELADTLLNPPQFKDQLYRIEKKEPNPIEKEEFEGLYKYYQGLHKSGYTREQDETQQAIKEAKNFILKNS